MSTNRRAEEVPSRQKEHVAESVTKCHRVVKYFGMLWAMSRKLGEMKLYSRVGPHCEDSDLPDKIHWISLCGIWIYNKEFLAVDKGVS